MKNIFPLFVLFSSMSVLSMRMTERGKMSAKRWLGTAQKEEAIKRKRDLLIFLDDSEKEKELGAVGDYLLMAIAQEVSPIIVSSSLLNNIMNETTQNYFIADTFLQSWIIKKINNSLILLIPVNYLQALNINIDKVKAFDNTMGTDVVSDIELQLGLKVNHMETIEYQPRHWSTYLKTQLLSYFYKSSESPQPEFADYFINSLDNIFCKRSNYQDKTINIPEWIIYLCGHGGFLHSVAHISFEDLKKFLHFLDTKISTQLLAIASCYAAGVNADKIYGEIKLGTQTYYSYPIIIQALNDVEVMSMAAFMGGIFYKNLNLREISVSNINFLSFFKKAKEEEGNYSEIIKPITLNFATNTPQIKLPRMEWFSVIDADKKIVSIGSTLVNTRDPQKPLDIISFFKKDPEIILLYTDNIPFELIVNSSKKKYIVSMVSSIMVSPIEEKPIKDIYTRIKKISSTQSFSDILVWFSPIIRSVGFNNFCIDEINDKKDIFILKTADDSMRVYYTDKDNIAFTTKLQGRETEIIFEKLDKDSEFDKYYQNFIHERDAYSALSQEEEKQEISSEQIKKIKDVQQKKIEAQKALKEAYTVSEPSVD